MDVRIKTKRQLKLAGLKNTWLHDVCPGKIIKDVRQATQADINRCHVRKGAKPEDYLCESYEGGSLINKKAVSEFIMSEKEYFGTKTIDVSKRMEINVTCITH